MADNEDKLILSADSSGLVSAAQKGYDALQKLSNLTGSTNSELNSLEKIAQRAATTLGGALASGFTKVGTSVTNSRSQLKGWGSDAQAVLSQLTKLEQQQRTITNTQLGSVALPSTIQPRTATGQFAAMTPAAVPSMSTAQLKEIASAYDLQRQTLEGLVRTELSDRDAKEAQVRAAQDVQRGTTVLTRQQAIASGQYQQTNRLVQALGGSSLPTLRYALYNVGFALGTVGTGLLGIDVLAVKTAVDFQQEFANVTRTANVTGAAAKTLESSFVSLSQSIPVSFADITNIGALGGQLGIAAGDLTSFTKTVAEFSATTNLSVDDAATALGRLGQLLQVPADQYNNLASSIVKVGVTSVATESQIVQIASNISSIGHSAGLTASQVIGLSGTLASLGVQPYISRGTLTRLFTDIESAVSSGGKSLQNFATVSGKSAAQFKSDWSNNSGAALVDLFQGLADGGDSIETLKALGISSSNDIPTIQKLTQNVDLLKKTLDTSGSSYASGSALAEQYGFISQTVAAKVQLLQNNFQAFLATIGQSTGGPLSAFIDLLDGVLQKLTAIAASPMGQTISFITLAFIGLVGVLATTAAGMAIVAATTLAVDTAFGAASVAAGVFRTALISTGIGAAVVLAGVLATAILGLSGAFDTGATRANAYFGDLTSLGDAMRKDQTIYEQTGKSIEQIATSQESATTSADAYVSGLQKATGAQVALNSNTSDTTKTIDNQTVAYGKNAKAALASALANSSSFQNLFKDNTFSTLNQYGAGANGKDFASAILGDPVKGGQEYVNKLRSSIEKSLNTGSVTLSRNPQLAQALLQLQQAADASSGAVSSQASAAAALSAADSAAGVSTDNLTGSIDSQTGQVQTLADIYGQTITDIFALVNAHAAESQALQQVGQDYANSGAAAAFSGQGIQSYINAVIGTGVPAQQAADQLQELVNSIIAQGLAANASAPSLVYLESVISALTGGKGSVDKGTVSLKSFATGFNSTTVAANKTAPAVGGVTKQVRTLVDYGNDIQSVLSRAFDIRFGSADALDDVTSKWQDLTDQLKQYRQQVEQLTADKAVQEYFVSVANAYGNTLAAGEAQANLDDISNQLSDAQAKASTQLDGNSEAAVNNRKTITDLVSGYEDYIEKLASSGASQSKINKAIKDSKAAFIAQATALGYSRQQLQPYIAAFGDMTIAIQKVPKNVTVTANTNPALQALAELQSKLKSQSGKTYSAGTIKAPKVTNPAPLTALNKAEEHQVYLQFLLANGAIIGKGNQKTLAKQFQSLFGFKGFARGGMVGGFAQGGQYLSGAGTGTSDSMMARVSNGEFINTAASVRYYGPQFFEDLNNRRVRRYAQGGPVGTVSGSTNNVTTVELGPRTLRWIASTNTPVYLDGKLLSENNSNYSKANSVRGRG